MSLGLIWYFHLSNPLENKYQSHLLSQFFILSEILFRFSKIPSLFLHHDRLSFTVHDQNLVGAKALFHNRWSTVGSLCLNFSKKKNLKPSLWFVLTVHSNLKIHWEAQLRRIYAISNSMHFSTGECWILCFVLEIFQYVFIYKISILISFIFRLVGRCLIGLSIICLPTSTFAWIQF